MANILVVDDEMGIRELLSEILGDEGHVVITAENAQQARESRTASVPDLVLLDIWMSGIDGRDICRYLKQNAATSNIPVVLLSASRDIEHSALAAGADDFLAKPFEIDDLLKKIEKYLS